MLKRKKKEKAVWCRSRHLWRSVLHRYCSITDSQTHYMESPSQPRMVSSKKLSKSRKVINQSYPTMEWKSFNWPKYLAHTIFPRIDYTATFRSNPEVLFLAFLDITHVSLYTITWTDSITNFVYSLENVKGRRFGIPSWKMEAVLLWHSPYTGNK